MRIMCLKVNPAYTQGFWKKGAETDMDMGIYGGAIVRQQRWPQYFVCL
jgi:hypothetical protein